MATTATSVEWLRVINTNTRRFIKGFEDDTMRDRKLLAKIKGAGGVKNNMDGDGVQWQVRRARGPVVINNGAQSVTHAPVNRFTKAFLDYQGYLIADAMTKREKLKNRGPSALIKVFDNLITHMTEDLEDDFSEKLYIDDSATGNTGNIAGIEAMMGTSSSSTSNLIATAAPQTLTEDAATPTARSYNAADRFVAPSDTYATISTILGNDGGSWAGGWPYGKGDAIFDYWSPIIVNGVSTGWGGSTWLANCIEAIRGAAIYSRKNKQASGGRANFGLFDNTAYLTVSRAQDSKERVTVTDQKTSDRRYGNPGDSVWIEGVEVTDEYGIPTNFGYLFNVDKVELWSMQDNLFEASDWFFDQPSNSWRMQVDFLGQLKFASPRHFCKFWTK